MTLFINIGLHFVKIAFNIGDFIDMFLASYIWIIAKYICIYMLFVIFFLIPSFAFVSEITGRTEARPLHTKQSTTIPKITLFFLAGGIKMARNIPYKATLKALTRRSGSRFPAMAPRAVPTAQQGDANKMAKANGS